MHVPGVSRLVVIASVLCGVLGAAAGQAGPPGGGAAASAMSPTGGYAAAIPLDLPSPRGAVPLPLSVVYTGLTRAGAAGSGWDVPLAYVAWQRPQRNRPSAGGHGQTPPRLVLSLGSGPMRMVKVDPAGTRFVPYLADAYMELVQDGTGWRLKTLDNLEYVFAPARGIEGGSEWSDPRFHDLWLLREVRDTVGGDHVVLRYDTSRVGPTCQPDLRLKSLAYTFEAGGRPLYEVELVHEPWWRPLLDDHDPYVMPLPGLARPCDQRNTDQGREVAYVLDRSVDDHIPTDRTTILREIRVLARNNLDADSNPRAIRTYHFGYAADADTDKPRLSSVRMTGDDGVTELPVATYRYGALAGPSPQTTTPTVTFGDPVGVRRSPELPAQFTDDVAENVETSVDLELPFITVAVQSVRTAHLLRDLTGDGIPDEIWKDGGKWYLAAGRLTAAGVDLDGPVSSWTSPAELFEQSTFRAVPQVGGSNGPEPTFTAITTSVWSQLVDWNGDGRADVIDVKGSADNDAWRIWINESTGPADVAWRPIDVDITAFRAYLLEHELVGLFDIVAPNWAGSGRTPLARSKSWPRVRSYACVERACPPGQSASDPNVVCDGPEQPCDDTLQYAGDAGSDTISEWTVADANADGYPDLLANSGPTLVCNSDGAARVPQPSLGQRDPTLEYRQEFAAHAENLIRTSACQGPRAAWDTGPVAFLNRVGAFHGGPAEAPFATPVSWPYEEHWSAGTDQPQQVGRDTDSPDAFSWQARQVADPDAIGALRARGADHADQSTAVYNTDHARVCVTSTDGHTVAQVVGEADLNGDGLADLIESPDGRVLGADTWYQWRVRFNTGGGYGPARDIATSHVTRFAMSEVTSPCYGTDEPPRHVATLLDLDADGLPDLLRISGSELVMASLAPSKSSDRGSVGRLTFVGNGVGAATAIRYGNAKRDRVSTHQVPFPENVVVEVATSVLDGSAVDLAPVHYRYGNAAMVYDGMSARWAFSGYRRQIVLAGRSSRPGEVEGVVTAYDHGPPAAPGASFAGKATSGRLQSVSRLEGTFAVDDLDQYLAPAATNPFAATTFTHGVRQLPLTSELDPSQPLAAYDCADQADGVLVPSPDECRGAGITFQAGIAAWEGNALITSHNTRAGRRVLTVDPWGRPTSIHDQGDLGRTDDDVCTTLTYGDGAPFPSVVTSSTVTDCGLGSPHQGPQPPQTLAATRLLYDHLPFGQVGAGRVTARWVDRFDDQGYQGTYLDASYTYDASGQIATVSSPRTLGGASTRTTTFTRDDFDLSVITTREAATDVPTVFVRTTLVSTWPSRGMRTIDQAGVATVIDLDRFGRPVRAGLEVDGTAWTLERTTYDDDPSGRRITVDSFPGDTRAGDEDTAPDRRRATTVLDALGRARFTQTELGASYGQSTIVSGLVRYDELGRAAFVAAPFESAELPFVPESLAATPYGTTSIFDGRGRLVRSVEAEGEQPLATTTSVAARVYVASVAYGYADGQATVTTLGPDEHDPTSPRAGHRDVAYLTAVGRETLRLRQSAQHVTLDRVDQGWDRLGRVVRTRRYADPAALTGATVWTSRYDSLGNRISLEEPGMSARTSTFDEDGNLLESAWYDGPSRRATRMTYDGFGRVTARTLVSQVPGHPASIESEDLFHYDVHSGNPAQPAQPAARLLGRLSWIEHRDVGVVFYGHDALGRGDAEIYAYDGHGLVRQSSTSTIGGTLTSLALETPHTRDALDYVHDSAGRLRQVRAGATVLADVLTTSPLGQHGVVRYGNDVTESFTYADRGRRELEKWTTATRDGDYLHERLRRDAAGRVLDERHTTPAGQTHLFASFDELGRLASRAQTGGVMPGLEAYGYDGLGNLRARLSTTGSGDRTYQPDDADPDRLCRYATPGDSLGGAGCHFVHDGAGNVTIDSSAVTPGAALLRTLAYDAGNRITTITRGASTVALTYGPLGRMKTDVTGPDARTVWRFGDLIEERTTLDGTVQIERTVPGPLGATISLRTRVHGDTTTTDTLYAHGDGRANRLFTRADGTVVQAPTYGAFGALTSGAAADTSLTSSTNLWNGGDHLPEVGLVLLGPRAYDPDLGRFLQRDPIAILARSTTANPYAFAFSDPINYADPTGLTPCDPLYCNRASSPGNTDFTAVAAGMGMGVAAYLLSVDSDSSGPHIRAGVGASALDVGVTAGSGSGRTCGTACQLFDSWHEVQVGSWEGGLDFLKGVASMPKCAINPGGCAIDTTRGFVETQIATYTAPRSVFCQGGCLRGVSRHVTGEVLGEIAGGLVSRSRPRGAQALAGAGGNWPRQGEKPGGALGQSRRDSCGPACGEMVSGISQQTLIQRVMNAGSALTDPQTLASAMGDRWRGGWASSKTQAFGVLMERGAWIARMQEKGSIGHFVVVDGFDPNGRLRMRDPWGGGTTYMMALSTFMKFWDGGAVWR